VLCDVCSTLWTDCGEVLCTGCGLLCVVCGTPWTDFGMLPINYVVACTGRVLLRIGCTILLIGCEVFFVNHGMLQMIVVFCFMVMSVDVLYA